MKLFPLLALCLLTLFSCKKNEAPPEFTITRKAPVVAVVHPGDGPPVDFRLDFKNFRPRDYTTVIHVEASAGASTGNGRQIPSTAMQSRDRVSFARPSDPKALHAWELSFVHLSSQPDSTTSGHANMRTRAFFEQVNALKASSRYFLGALGNVHRIHVKGARDETDPLHTTAVPEHMYMGFYAFPEGPLKKGMTYTIARRGGGRRMAGSTVQPALRITIDEVSPTRIRYTYGGRRFNPGIMRSIMEKMSGRSGPRISDVLVKFKGYMVIDLERGILLARHGEYARIKITVRGKGRRFSMAITSFANFAVGPSDIPNPLPKIFEAEVVNQSFVD